GLMLSVPLLMYGSLLLARLMDDYPLLIPAGAAVLGWLAGSLAVSDALWGDWVATQAPALQLVVPLLGAVFVLLESRIIREQRPKLPPMPPWRPFEPLTRRLALLGEANIQPQAAAVPAAEACLEPVSHAAIEPTPPPAEAQSAQLDIAALAAPETIAAENADAEDFSAKNRLSPALRLLVGAAALIGILVLLWLGWHLLSQGLLPTPKHPIKPAR
uniref:hypothetical protein n=1 Tax=Chromobacterium sp. ASV23 TaxID=2795110 RepID=UPI0018EBA38B